MSKPPKHTYPPLTAIGLTLLAGFVLCASLLTLLFLFGCATSQQDQARKLGQRMYRDTHPGKPATIYEILGPTPGIDAPPHPGWWLNWSNPVTCLANTVQWRTNLLEPWMEYASLTNGNSNIIWFEITHTNEQTFYRVGATYYFLTP